MGLRRMRISSQAPATHAKVTSKKAMSTVMTQVIPFLQARNQMRFLPGCVLEARIRSLLYSLKAPKLYRFWTGDHYGKDKSIRDSR
jgi:hypothetical protein